MSSCQDSSSTRPLAAVEAQLSSVMGQLSLLGKASDAETSAVQASPTSVPQSQEGCHISCSPASQQQQEDERHSISPETATVNDEQHQANLQQAGQQEQEQGLQHQHQEQHKQDTDKTFEREPQAQSAEQGPIQQQQQQQESQELYVTEGHEQGHGTKQAESLEPAVQVGEGQQDKGEEDKEVEARDEEAEESKEEEGQGEDEHTESALANFMQRLGALAAGGMGQQVTRATGQRLLPTLDINGVASLIKNGKVKRIVCMCGAGISVSAGIPDFRTPGTGLYSQLASYNLPRPEAVFSLPYFRENPEPFHRLAKELFPGHYKPTVTHYFMSLLHKKGVLLRCFTQNIDSLETLAGLPKHMVVPAHGNFDSASCISCGKAHSTEWVRKTIFAGQICRCRSCSSLVKPDIVFFGEALPEEFDLQRKLDLPQCDLLITMGTSLAVWPFAGLLHDVELHTPRLLINREVVGLASKYDLLMGTARSIGYMFYHEDNYRDVLYQGDCDDGVRLLSDLLGWRQELEELVQQAHAAMDAAAASDKASSNPNIDTRSSEV